MDSCNEKSISANVFKCIVSDMKDQIIQEFSNSFDLLKKRVIFLEQSMDKMKRNFSVYERERKRKNVIIKGLVENETEEKNLQLRVTNFFKEKLGVQLDAADIDVAFRVGKSRDAGKSSRHVIVKLTTERKKIEIMSKKWKLKNTKIYIDNDLPKNILEKQYLSRQMRRASKKNSNYDTKVRSNRNYKKLHRGSKNITPIPKNYEKNLDTLPNTPSQSQ
jgi:hypothetical protein